MPDRRVYVSVILTTLSTLIYEKEYSSIDRLALSFSRYVPDFTLQYCPNFASIDDLKNINAYLWYIS